MGIFQNIRYRLQYEEAFMIRDIKFENFRGFQNLELTDLKPVTLISGRNNAGKSSLVDHRKS